MRMGKPRRLPVLCRDTPLDEGNPPRRPAASWKREIEGNMKCLLTLLLVAPLLAAPDEAMGQPARPLVPLFSVAISGTKDVVPAGAKVIVKAEVTNNGRRAIWFDRDSMGCEVRLSDGSPLAMKESYRLQKIRERSVVLLIPGDWLAPGQTYRFVYVMSDMYDLSHPAQYIIRARQSLPGGSTLALSNAIDVEVTPASVQPSPESGTEASKASFSLEIEACQDMVRPRARVGISIKATNTTDHDIDLHNSMTLYSLNVRDSRGVEPPLTEAGKLMKKLHGNDGGGGVRLKPGETKGEGAFGLDELYDLSRPGEYTLQISRTDPETNALVKSNSIAITVERANAYKSRRARAPQFSIAISTQQSTLASGGELKIKAELRNESAYAINSAEDCSLELEVFDEDGWIPVPTTQSWERRSRQPTFRRVAVRTVQPGETQKCVFAVGEMYEIARPGRYYIQMKRRDFQGTLVKSNPLRVTVLAPYASASLSFPPPAPVKPTFSITINTPQAVIKSGASLPVKIVVTNVSDQVIDLDLDEARYWTDVRDEKGRLAPQTKYGHELTGDQFAFPPPKNTSFTVPIEPGTSANAVIDVAELFDLSRAGSYTIQVDKSDRKSKAWMQSNVIAVSVIPADSAAVPAATPMLAGSAVSSRSAPVAIKLSTGQTTVRAGAEIWLDATTMNLSDHKMAIGFLPGPYESPGLSVIVQARDNQGRPVGAERLDQSGCKGIPGCKAMFSESRYVAP